MNLSETESNIDRSLNSPIVLINSITGWFTDSHDEDIEFDCTFECPITISDDVQNLTINTWAELNDMFYESWEWVMILLMFFEKKKIAYFVMSNLDIRICGFDGTVIIHSLTADEDKTILENAMAGIILFIEQYQQNENESTSTQQRLRVRDDNDQDQRENTSDSMEPMAERLDDE